MASMIMSIPCSCRLFPARQLHVQGWRAGEGRANVSVFCTASSSSPSSLNTAQEKTELDAISEFSEIVPDTMIFDDFERFPPTAATVSSSLLLGICSLPKTQFGSVIETALADSECYAREEGSDRLSCIFNKAVVNVGAQLAKVVPGRVSTEVDARLAYDTHGTIRKVHELLKLYKEVEVPQERLLFKIPATWQGIEASRLLEAEGIQTHVTFVYSFPQAAAAAQAGSSVIQMFIGRVRDWARNHNGDQEIENALSRGEDPGIALVNPHTHQVKLCDFGSAKILVTKSFNYIHKYGHKSKLMAAAIRNKQDIFSLLGVDYLIVPLKILQSLKESRTLPDDKYSFVKRLSSDTAQGYNFTAEELVTWDQLTFASAMGPAAEELLAAGLDGYMNQSKRVEEYFTKIWPPPNV
ncbi:uncharacterized protein LOC131066538 isoform X2 [Cryptomeria japonica]|uniref:uncharacterized protein LOC131066538 isoform X2 n=1 Tax=Cryptomeria japonica TaxID=3369 RepID=UPI0025AC7195|nr:uncharacterized protein LOC131066538 isoform X2 [Cryptomeria japonica]